MTDDWHKPRGHHEHLTDEEKAKIRAAFDAGRKPSDIARELQCSTRVAAGYFAKFRAPPKPTVQRFRPQLPCRHRKPSFEL